MLVLCDTCPLAYHLACGGLLKVPKGAWSCPRCKDGAGATRGEAKRGGPARASPKDAARAIGDDEEDSPPAKRAAKHKPKAAKAGKTPGAARGPPRALQRLTGGVQRGPRRARPTTPRAALRRSRRPHRSGPQEVCTYAEAALPERIAPRVAVSRPAGAAKKVVTYAEADADSDFGMEDAGEDDDTADDAAAAKEAKRAAGRKEAAGRSPRKRAWPRGAARALRWALTARPCSHRNSHAASRAHSARRRAHGPRAVAQGRAGAACQVRAAARRQSRAVAVQRGRVVPAVQARRGRAEASRAGRLRGAHERDGHAHRSAAGPPLGHGRAALLGGAAGPSGGA